jgi:elongation factor G
MNLMFLVFQPLPPEENTQVVFSDETTGTNIPKNFIPAIQKVQLSFM